jgi:hypothetical protein
MMDRRRGKRLVFYGVLLCFTASLVEVVAWVGYRMIFGESFSYAGLQGARLAVLHPRRETQNPGSQLGPWVIHPYYGYVTNPAIAADIPRGLTGSPINQFGFFGREVQIQPRDPGTLVVAVVGGSVAAQLALPAYAGEALQKALKGIPAFRDQRIVIVDLANGGFKQPQGLIIVNDIVSRGGHIDLLIALDGFNEIAAPDEYGNVRDGISPFYPQSWRQLVDGRLSRDQLTALGKAQLMGDTRGWLAWIFAKPILRHGVTSNLIWRVADVQVQKREMAYRRAVQAAPPAEADSRLTSDKRGFLGPVTEYGTRRELYVDIARHWVRSSVLLNNILADQGGLYMHFLQPNQYVAGSKPMGARERRIAISRDSPYRRPVEVGYPYMRAAGQSLKQAGIWFEDLTMAFADTPRELYSDNCCHVNEDGYHILANAIAASLATYLAKSANGEIRAVALDRVDLGDAVFASHALRRLAAKGEDYRDGAEEVIRPARKGIAAQQSGLVEPESWQAYSSGAGSFETAAGRVIVRGQNRLFTERECRVAKCRVAFSLDVERADEADIGLQFYNGRGELLAQTRHPISGHRGTARVESDGPESTRKVRAFVHSPGGVVEFRKPFLDIQGRPSGA